MEQAHVQDYWGMRSTSRILLWEFKLQVNITDWKFSLKSFHIKQSFSDIINKTVNPATNSSRVWKCIKTRSRKLSFTKNCQKGYFLQCFSYLYWLSNYEIWLELWSIVKILINILKSVKSSSVFCTCVICQALGQGVRLHPQLLGREVQEFVFSDKTVEDSQVVWARPSYGSRDLRRPWPWPKLPSLADTEEGHVC